MSDTSPLSVALAKDRDDYAPLRTCSPDQGACIVYQRSAQVYGLELGGSWLRVGFSLGTSPGPAARVRLTQPAGAGSGFAIDNLYIGAGCVGLCSGHGKCTLGGACVCDAGFSGSRCELAPRLETFVMTAFTGGLPARLTATAGAVTTSTCAITGETLVFSGDGRRSVTTDDMDTRGASTLRFQYRVCAGSGSVVLSLAYSLNGGVTWTRLARLDSTSTVAQTHTTSLPAAAQSPSTRFHIYQARVAFGTWSLDDFAVGGACLSNMCTNGTVCRDTVGNAFECVCPYGQRLDAKTGACVLDKCANVTCLAADDCNDAGACSPDTGSCSTVALNGSACAYGNDSQATGVCLAGTCTAVDRCAGVLCAPSGACRMNNTCSPATGLCVAETVADGSDCDDDDTATFGDVCRSGLCVGATNMCVTQGVTCPAASDCEMVGVCQPATGTCSPRFKPNGTECETGSSDTVGSCQLGKMKRDGSGR